MSCGWKFWLFIGIAVSVGITHAVYEAFNSYLSDTGVKK